MASKTGTILARGDRPFSSPERPPKLSDAIEAKKMVAFHCPTGNHSGLSPLSVKACMDEGHDPYYSDKWVKITVPQFEERDGKRIARKQREDEVEFELVRTPNWEQVIQDLADNSGRNVERRLAQGWVFPEELGYAPFCDFFGCSIQNPKFRTSVGTYHHRDEAAIIYLTKGGDEDSEEGTAVYIDDTTSGRARRRQLNEASRIAADEAP